MSGFNTYITPAPHALFSKEFFETVTVERVASIAESYPQISPAGSLRHWEWKDDEPASAGATVILPSEVVPHPDDVRSITAGMQAAFNQGKRSVMVFFASGGMDYQYIYHFSKVSPCLALQRWYPDQIP